MHTCIGLTTRICILTHCCEKDGRAQSAGSASLVSDPALLVNVLEVAVMCAGVDPGGDIQTMQKCTYIDSINGDQWR